MCSGAVAVRLITYNAHGLRAGVERVAGVLRELAPDVVCPQEAPRRVRWRTRAADLATRAGLVYVTGGHPTSGTMLLCAQRGTAWLRLAGELRDAYAVAPHGGAATFGRGWRIDGVFVTDGIEVTGCGVPDVPGAGTASDHRPGTGRAPAASALTGRRSPRHHLGRRRVHDSKCSPRARVQGKGGSARSSRAVTP